MTAYAQPLDSDLTAIAALSTTTYGRALLTLANQAALMGLLTSASETGQGIVELATQTETNAGTDDARAVTPLKLQTRLAAYAQPLDSDLTAIAALTTTAYGRGFLALADATAARTALALGTAATKDTGTGANQIPVLSGAPGTPNGTKFLRDDGTWAAAAGGGSELLASTAYNPASVTGVTNATTTFTDVDATNLTVTFTVPASGAVIVSLCAAVRTNGVPAMWGVGVAGTVVAATTATMTPATSNTRAVHRVKITGLTPAASVTYRWMHANGGTSTTTTSYGGAGAGALGQALMEVWSA